MQNIDSTALVASIVVGFLTGLVTSAAVALYFTRRAERRERRMSILQKAHDVARECQSLLELTERILYDLGCRKYTAHQLAKNTAALTGEEKRRTVNRETMRIHLQEVPRGGLDNLTIALHSHLTAMPCDDGQASLFIAAKEADEATFVLTARLKEILSFRDYFDQVGFKAEQKSFEDFVETMEQDEMKSYQDLLSARDAARGSLLKLVQKIAEYSVEGRT